MVLLRYRAIFSIIFDIFRFIVTFFIVLTHLKCYNKTRVRRIPCGTVNCYLLTGDRGSVLVDTGWAGYGEKLLSACLGQDVRLILLTHGHVDHIQNVSGKTVRRNNPAAART